MEASFKEELLSRLSEGGGLHALKERLRSEVSKSLIPSSESSQALRKPKKQLRRVLDALFEDYLENNHYHYSLSVFQPESGSRGQSLSHRDVLRTLHIEPGSELYKALKRRGYGRQSDGATKPGLATALLEAVMEVSSTAKHNKDSLENSSTSKQAEIQKLELRQAELEARIRSLEGNERRKGHIAVDGRAAHGDAAIAAGTGLNVQERLQQAAASSWVAKATDEPVWMAWAQQSDSLIDEVLAGCETMLQCVEDARMALAATEQDAADLRRQLGQVLTERHDLVAALPDLAPVMAWGPGNITRPATPSSRAAEVLATEQRMKQGVRALQRKVLSHRQTATAHLAHSLACMGVKPPEAPAGRLHGPPGYEAPSSGASSVQAFPQEAKAAPAAPSQRNTSAQETMTQQQRLNSARAAKLQSASDSTAHAGITTTEQEMGQAAAPTVGIQVRLQDGTRMALVPLADDSAAQTPQPATVPAGYPQPSALSHAGPETPAQTLSAGQERHSSPFETARDSHLSNKQSQQRGRNAGSTAAVTRAASIPILSGMLDSTSSMPSQQPSRQRVSAQQSLQKLQAQQPSQQRVSAQQPISHLPALQSVPQTAKASNGSPVEHTPVVHVREEVQRLEQGQLGRGEMTAHPATLPSQETASAAVGRAHSEVDVGVEPKPVSDAADPADTLPGHRQAGYSVFAGLQAPRSPVRSPSTSLLEPDASNFYLASDYGPLVLTSLPDDTASGDAADDAATDLAGIPAGDLPMPQPALSDSPPSPMSPSATFSRPSSARSHTSINLTAASSMAMSLAERGQLCEPSSQPVMTSAPVAPSASMTQQSRFSPTRVTHHQQPSEGSEEAGSIENMDLELAEAGNSPSVRQELSRRAMMSAAEAAAGGASIRSSPSQSHGTLVGELDIGPVSNVNAPLAPPAAALSLSQIPVPPLYRPADAVAAPALSHDDTPIMASGSRIPQPPSAQMTPRMMPPKLPFAESVRTVTVSSEYSMEEASRGAMTHRGARGADIPHRGLPSPGHVTALGSEADAEQQYSDDWSDIYDADGRQLV